LIQFNCKTSITQLSFNNKGTDEHKLQHILFLFGHMYQFCESRCAMSHDIIILLFILDEIVFTVSRISGTPTTQRTYTMNVISNYKTNGNCSLLTDIKKK